jgi:hypothetical protein
MTNGLIQTLHRQRENRFLDTVFIVAVAALLATQISGLF